MDFSFLNLLWIAYCFYILYMIFLLYSYTEDFASIILESISRDTFLSSRKIDKFSIFFGSFVGIFIVLLFAPICIIVGTSRHR